MNYPDRDRATDPQRTTFADGAGLQPRQEQRGVFQPSDRSVDSGSDDIPPDAPVAPDAPADHVPVDTSPANLHPGITPPSPDQRARLVALAKWSIGPGRWWTATAGIVASLAAVLVLARGQLDSTARDPIRSLAVGACFNLTDTTPFTLKPCDQPHDNEVYYRFTMPPGRYLGDQGTDATAVPICDARLADYVGRSASDLPYFDWPDTPDQIAWDHGDRVVICALARDDNAKITGTVRAAK